MRCSNFVGALNKVLGDCTNNKKLNKRERPFWDFPSNVQRLVLKTYASSWYEDKCKYAYALLYMCMKVQIHSWIGVFWWSMCGLLIARIILCWYSRKWIINPNRDLITHCRLFILMSVIICQMWQIISVFRDSNRVYTNGFFFFFYPWTTFTLNFYVEPCKTFN